MLHTKVNYDFTLSCEGVAKLFGYTSGAQGMQIEQKLKRKGLLNVQRRPSLFISKHITRESFQTIKNGYPNHPVWSRCFMTDRGVVLLRRSNQLELNGQHDFYRFFNELNTSRGGISKTTIGSVEKERILIKENKNEYLYLTDIKGGRTKILSKKENSFYINPLTLKETKLY